MARLVLQPLEYNLCVECALDSRVEDPTFLGPTCFKHSPARPHQSNDPTVARDRLLLMDTAVPMYERQMRWACPRSGFLHKKRGWCQGAGADGTPCEPCHKRGKADKRGGKLSSRPTFVWVPTPDAALAIQDQMQLQTDGDDDVGQPLDDNDVGPEGDRMPWNPAPASVRLAAHVIADMARHHVSREAGDEDGKSSPGAGPGEEPAPGDAHDQEKRQ